MTGVVLAPGIMMLRREKEVIVDGGARRLRFVDDASRSVLEHLEGRAAPTTYSELSAATGETEGRIWAVVEALQTLRVVAVTSASTTLLQGRTVAHLARTSTIGTDYGQILAATSIVPRLSSRFQLMDRILLESLEPDRPGSLSPGLPLAGRILVTDRSNELDDNTIFVPVGGSEGRIRLGPIVGGATGGCASCARRRLVRSDDAEHSPVVEAFASGVLLEELFNAITDRAESALWSAALTIDTDLQPRVTAVHCDCADGPNRTVALSLEDERGLGPWISPNDRVSAVSGTRPRKFPSKSSAPVGSGGRPLIERLRQAWTLAGSVGINTGTFEAIVFGPDNEHRYRLDLDADVPTLSPLAGVDAGSIDWTGKVTLFITVDIDAFSVLGPSGARIAAVQSGLLVGLMQATTGTSPAPEDATACGFLAASLPRGWGVGAALRLRPDRSPDSKSLPVDLTCFSELIESDQSRPDSSHLQRAARLCELRGYQGTVEVHGWEPPESIPDAGTYMRLLTFNAAAIGRRLAARSSGSSALQMVFDVPTAIFGRADPRRVIVLTHHVQADARRGRGESP